MAIQGLDGISMTEVAVIALLFVIACMALLPLTSK
jgi:hypothetical protein